jgi:sugar lactone lactonase YvrE
MGREAEKGAGAIYRFHRGELVRLYAGVGIPNAICFSPDGATAYFTDSCEGVLYRVAIDPANAMPVGNPRHSMTIAAGSVPSTAPSSIVTD